PDSLRPFTPAYLGVVAVQAVIDCLPEMSALDAPADERRLRRHPDDFDDLHAGGAVDPHNRGAVLIPGVNGGGLDDIPPGNFAVGSKGEIQVHPDSSGYLGASNVPDDH